MASKDTRRLLEVWPTWARSPYKPFRFSRRGNRLFSINQVIGLEEKTLCRVRTNLGKYHSAELVECLSDGKTWAVNIKYRKKQEGRDIVVITTDADVGVASFSNESVQNITSEIYSPRVTSTGAGQLPGHVSIAPSNPSLSADSSIIAWVYHGDAYIQSIKDNEVVARIDLRSILGEGDVSSTHSLDIERLAISDDGDELALKTDRAIYVVNLESKVLTTVVTANRENELGDYSVSNDFKSIAFEVNGAIYVAALQQETDTNKK